MTIQSAEVHNFFTKTETESSFEVVYSPEDLVGGDFYRIDRVGADTYAVMVADVMGHGVASALYTMQLRSLWEECHQAILSPARFVSELNCRLHRLASPDGYFATAVFVLFDAVTGRIRYVRAGHPAPILLRANGGVERLNATSPAIGLLADASYHEAQCHLDAGDSLVLFTDGAVEILNAAEEPLDDAGLVRLLEASGRPRPDLRRLERQLLEFSNQIRLPDDLTLLSLHRT